ncbi:MAG TPA: APC family permease [Tepidisphaeraceae bacterium]|jgi:amino acid transporter|nr:APC family permease [Tepidisphaeraceae bacterium]
MASVPPSSSYDVAQLPDASARRRINVLLVSSVALAFISFWRAAAIVLCDLASTAYYIGGISEQAIGKAAPWFILGVMVFSYAVRSVYVESCTMFTRGGVYKVVRGALGGNLAKLAVSALMFDYVLTGPISAVSAGQYITSLAVDCINLLHHKGGAPFALSDGVVGYISALIAIGITLYFWRLNIIGMHESSTKALRIMQMTTVMGVIIIIWSAITLGKHPEKLHMPPIHPVMTGESSGWLEHLPRLVGMLGILIAFGHSVLAMSGEESLAQVNREIESPKLKNLLRAGFVIFIYSMLLTTLISFFAVLIIPDGKRVASYIVPDGKTLANYKSNDGSVSDDVKQVDYLRPEKKASFSDTPTFYGYELSNVASENPKVETDKPLRAGPGTGFHIERDNGGYRDNLIGGLAMNMVGPKWAKLLLQAFVVIVGFLILAGAVNTSLVGSNGVMNRLAEDGILTPWFLHPQKRYGTTHRLINLIGVLQIIVIVASLGDVNELGEAYAFGVIWSFVFMTLAMVVFRFKDKSKRQYEVPLNIRIKRASGDHIDLPIGIALVCLILLSTAIINLATKKTATIWGTLFTIGFLIAFVICETIAHRRRKGEHHEHLEQFNQSESPELTVESIGLSHPHPILVAARGPRSLPMMEKVLTETDTDARDVVVMTCKVLPAFTMGVTPEEMTLDDGDRGLLTEIVTVAEHIGKQVYPVVMPTNNPLYAIACAARDLKATEVVLGVSEKYLAEEQLEQFALAWGSATAEPGVSSKMTVRIIGPQVEMREELD